VESSLLVIFGMAEGLLWYTYGVPFGKQECWRTLSPQ
jgi:hypothetical protein